METPIRLTMLVGGTNVYVNWDNVTFFNDATINGALKPKTLIFLVNHDRLEVLQTPEEIMDILVMKKEKLGSMRRHEAPKR